MANAISRNPFQAPQFGSKPVAQGPQAGRANPFQSAGAAKPSGDALTTFKSQLPQLNPNQPAPPQGMGRKLCVSG